MNVETLGLPIVVTQFAGLALDMDANLETSHNYPINGTAEGKILWISDSTAKTLRLRREDAAGRNLSDILPAAQMAHTHKIDEIVWNVAGTPFHEAKVFEILGAPERDGVPELDGALNFYHPDDVEIVSTKVRQASVPRAKFEFEARLIQKNGNEIKVRSQGIATSDGSGTVTKIVDAYERID